MKPPAMSITMIRLDTAKSIFQVHAVDKDSKAQMRRKLRRDELLWFFEKQAACTVVLAVHSVRCLLVKQQTMLANAMRGLATEFSLTVPKGIGKLDELMALVDADKAFRASPSAVHRIVRPLPGGCRKHQGVRSWDCRARAQ